MIHQGTDGQTDRQTDDMQSQDRALHCSALRGKNGVANCVQLYVDILHVCVSVCVSVSVTYTACLPCVCVCLSVSLCSRHCTVTAHF